ncbi:RidA family protein [Lacipirellula limnantheis]|uniref:Endoribonuclease L-PSP n=1 Tax=Lacipirellula limnantheis TaxID=2528024 RepID=A0A517TT68_9BACT|nr:RidA family protein [Lacipirellula limnantheis]QDT71571.1 Endoribonuclease L-PSP [Lacipirellula limnantheis]
MSADARLAELKLELPPAPKAVGVYRPVVEIDGLLYISGHGPLRPDGSLTKGRVGADLDTAAGYQAARQTGLAILATLQKHCGSLDKIARLVKTLGLVHATPEFVDHPAVINGFSELMRDVFGEEHGVAARSAVGAVSLPGGIAVEVEAIFQLKR